MVKRTRLEGYVVLPLPLLLSLYFWIGERKKDVSEFNGV
jgi:hypothetical protein